MGIKKIERTRWDTYFNAFSQTLMRSHRVDYAEIRVLSTEFGAQQETTWLPLQGITFDAKSDLLEVLVENMDHLVWHPSEIYVDEAADGTLMRFEVLRKDGTREIIELR